MVKRFPKNSSHEFSPFLLQITYYVTRPIFVLLGVVERINDGQINDEFPTLQGGSSEVHNAHNTFARLVKMIRMSNIAFYSGNLFLALDFISEALNLFRNVGDRKATGIACNNLGNTIYAVIEEANNIGGIDSGNFTGNDSEVLEDIGAKCEIAIRHYDEAVAIAEANIQETEDEATKALFVMQLSDRLFNRALFGLLAFRSGLGHVHTTRQVALQTLLKVRELDYSVKDFWLEYKLLLSHSADYFDRILRRLHGILDNYDDLEVRDLWNPNELIDEADQLLLAAWNEPGASLFDTISPVGRLQQLESAAMRHDLLQGHVMNAARLAMRMFAEDEFLMESALSTGAAALSALMQIDDHWTGKTKTSCRQDLRRMLRSCKHRRNIDLGKSVLVAVELNERLEGEMILDELYENCVQLYNRHCFNDDSFGVVAFTTSGDMSVPLGIKQENEGRQRASLELAFSATGDVASPALPFAIQMVVDSATLSPGERTDSYILLIADGYSWDPALRSIRPQIERLNRELTTSMIHLFILGVDIEELEVMEEYRELCGCTPLSFYTDVTMDNIGSAFELVGALIRGQRLSAHRFQCLTMEKF